MKNNFLKSESQFWRFFWQSVGVLLTYKLVNFEDKCEVIY